MSGNSFGKIFKITTFGESHGKVVGVVIDGCPAGVKIDYEFIQKQMDRRRVGQSWVVSPRQERDKVEILSGVFKGYTTGTPILMLVYNKDVKSEHYEKIKDYFRPGHADLTYHIKYGLRDWRGGGRASARETIGRVAAGAIAQLILNKFNIKIWAFTKKIGNIEGKKINRDFIEENPLRCADENVLDAMLKLIKKMKESGDSIGSLVEVHIENVPAGLGEPVFEKVNAQLAKAYFSIPAVKGVEFGAGFSVVEMKGSENNDQIEAHNGKIQFLSNNAGGTLGGITTGQDIIARIAFKPPSSIGMRQKTVDRNLKNVELKVEGRFDPCIAPRAVPVVEAMSAIVILDFILVSKKDKFEFI